MPETYSIVLTGEVLPGFTVAKVAPALARMFKITDDQALALLSGRETVVKRNLALGEVARYLQALQHAGVNVRSEPAASPASPLPQAVPATEQRAPAVKLALEPTEDTAPAEPRPSVTPAADIKAASTFHSRQSQVVDEQEDESDAYDLELAARGQKLIIYSIVLNFVFISAQRGFAVSAGVLLGMGLLLTALTINGVIKIGSGLMMTQRAKIVCMVLSIFPVINLLVLIYLSRKTTGMLRSAGWEVGLFGARS